MYPREKEIPRVDVQNSLCNMELAGRKTCIREILRILNPANIRHSSSLQPGCTAQEELASLDHAEVRQALRAYDKGYEHEDAKDGRAIMLEARKIAGEDKE